jgi:hypothetical protein
VELFQHQSYWMTLFNTKTGDVVAAPLHYYSHAQKQHLAAIMVTAVGAAVGE